MERITFTAIGTYDRTIPVDLIDALLDEIETHMQGYGFKDIQVEANPARGEQTDAR
jgi:hypothetical protein